MDDPWAQFSDAPSAPSRSGGKRGGAVSGGPPGSGETASVRSAARAKVAAGRMLLGQLDDVEQQYKAGFTSPDFVDRVMEFVPWTDKAKGFNAAAKGVTLLGRQAFRVPGSGADSDRELQTLLDAVQPSSGDFDAANVQKFRQLRRMVGDMEREYAPIAGMPVRPVPSSRFFPAPGGVPGRSAPKAASSAPKVLRYNPATGELE
jgi:hypothetical protein